MHPPLQTMALHLKQLDKQTQTPKASTTQRAGRAGRVRPGHCFRLCTEDDYQRLLPAATTPEMQRSDLAGLLLQLKVGAVPGFGFGFGVSLVYISMC
jgi:HrpA-like RNA helicase